MNLIIIVVKETRAGEKRVALIPQDAKMLIDKGHTLFIEHDAGKQAGFNDEDYEKVGATIRYLEDGSLLSYKKLFTNINCIVRAKRPARNREELEYQAISPHTIMIGGLDPLEKHSSHIEEYHRANIIAYSIDQLTLALDDPMNILAAMSKIAGRLALDDAIKKFNAKEIKKIVLIGFGVVGQAAFQEAITRGLAHTVTVVRSQSNSENEVQVAGGKVMRLNKEVDLSTQQQLVKNILSDADIVITSARRANQAAPLLIPAETLHAMQSGSVIVDMALSEGGNVEGSEHDATLTLGNQVIVTNTSGYPKIVPHEASALWSRASLHFILRLANHDILLKPL